MINGGFGVLWVQAAGGRGDPNAQSDAWLDCPGPDAHRCIGTVEACAATHSVGAIVFCFTAQMQVALTDPFASHMLH
jgi:hypothetical protein